MTSPDSTASSSPTPSSDAARSGVAAQPFAKIFTARCDVPVRDFIDVFHGWVKTGRTGELLIDVHDYSHVHEGPGVILVGHTCHYGMDRRDGRLGLVYRARRTEAAPLEAGLALATRAVTRAAALLEDDMGGRLAFDTSELWLGFEDRLHAPNTEPTFEKFEPELASFATRLFTGQAQVKHAGGDRDVFGATVTGPARPLAELAAALD